VAAGQWLTAQRPGWLHGAIPRAARGLALLGRWSLSFYMIHQPVLIGLLSAVVALWR
jgi:peptidoglycan/LPS O-acetylase OafA/YrhL